MLAAAFLLLASSRPPVLASHHVLASSRPRVLASDTVSTTTHTTGPLRYTARAGFLDLNDEFHQTRGRIFYVYYHLDGARVPRPVTFAWNGGPGSNASLLHLGTMGPMRVKDEKPWGLTENESTWLDATDLVFVDPIGTGYSYAPSPELSKTFWSPKGDIDATAEFIRLFLSEYDYGADPAVYLVGESYGTFRAAGTAGALSERGIKVKGVVLISPILDFRLSLGDTPPTELPYVSLIPSYTAAAFIHKKLPADLMADGDAAVRKAEDWALTQYSGALLKGDRLTDVEKDLVAKQYERYTGISAKVASERNLRLSMGEFSAELLKGEQKAVGHYDIRRTTSTLTSGGEYDPRLDPSLDTHGSGDLIVPYLRSELKFESNALYAGPFGGKWPPPTQHRGDWMSVRWDWSDQGQLDAGPALARAMRSNPSLRVLVISGMYDLATPFFDADYTFSHMGLGPARNRVELARYKAGHMVYLDPENRARLKKDFASLLEKTR